MDTDKGCALSLSSAMESMRLRIVVQFVCVDVCAQCWRQQLHEQNSWRWKKMNIESELAAQPELISELTVTS